MESFEKNIFNMNYSALLGKVQDDVKVKKNKWTSIFWEIIKKNKILSLTIIVFLFCFILNCILIFNFFRILENM